MAYDDTHCVCRGPKPTGTLLCDPCLTHVATLPDRFRDLKTLRGTDTTTEFKRAAAIRLLATARTRTKK